MTAAAVDGPPPLDPTGSNIILLVGKKGSGKSYAAERLYADYPFSKLVLDISGDAMPAGAEPITEIPSKLPEGEDGRPVNLRYVPDPGSPTYRDDLDRAVGLALYPKDRPALVWIDEVGEVTKGTSVTPPHFSRLLMQSRHYGPASALLCGPRPMRIDPLCVGQADLIYIYRVPNPADRQRLAEMMGYPPKRLSAELDETTRRGKYWHLLYDGREDGHMYRMPPIPAPPKAAAP